MKLPYYIFFAFFVVSTFSPCVADSGQTIKYLDYARDGLICTARKGPHRCRKPTRAEEYQFVKRRTELRDRYWNLYHSCDFSMFRSWSSEISRFEKLRRTEQEHLSVAKEELRWAQRDARNPNLPSDTVRDGIANSSTYRAWTLDSRRELARINWCLECARKRKGGSKDCKDFEDPLQTYD